MCHKCKVTIKHRDQFSHDGKRRYMAWRAWDEKLPNLAALLANPTKCQGPGDNPTIQAVMAIACRNGFGTVYIVNLDPRISVSHLSDGPVLDAANEDAIDVARQECRTWWLAWGIAARNMDAARIKKWHLDLISRHDLLVLGWTKDGYPLHPARKSHNQFFRPHLEYSKIQLLD